MQEPSNEIVTCRHYLNVDLIDFNKRNNHKKTKKKKNKYLFGSKIMVLKTPPAQCQISCKYKSQNLVEATPHLDLLHAAPK